MKQQDEICVGKVSIFEFHEEYHTWVVAKWWTRRYQCTMKNGKRKLWIVVMSSSFQSHVITCRKMKMLNMFRNFHSHICLKSAFFTCLKARSRKELSHSHGAILSTVFDTQTAANVNCQVELTKLHYSGFMLMGIEEYALLLCGGGNNFVPSRSSFVTIRIEKLSQQRHQKFEWNDFIHFRQSKNAIFTHLFIKYYV